MENLHKIYEGKAKEIFETEDKNLIIMHYKDDASAYNGIKKAQIKNKGILNNKISSLIYQHLEQKGVPTHFVKRIDDRNQLCKKVDIFPLEVIVRNYVAGSMAKRLGVLEGTKSDNTIFEICYKNDTLGDPLINDHHAVSLHLATYDELAEIYKLANKINEILIELFKTINIDLIDFKAEFGKTSDGSIVLADEISPDSARLWDMSTHEKLDKDRFRRDLGKVKEAYEEIYNRLETL